MNSCIFFASGTRCNDTPYLSFEKKNVIFDLFFKSKIWSLLIFEIQFPMLFIFMFVQGQPEMKSGHFIYLISYTLYLARKAMGIIYIIRRSHQVSFLACLHPIHPHCHKPHQQAFLVPKKGAGMPF